MNFVDNINDGVYRLDARGYFTFVNKAILDRSGIRRDRFLTLHFLDIVAPEDHERVMRNFEKVMKGEAVPPYELSYRTGDGGMLTVEINTTPIYEGDRVIGLQGISRDITERKEMEAQRRQLQKAESLGRMAGAIAHHFNNQLQVVLGNLDIALSDLGHPEQAVQSLTEAMGAAREAARVSGHMLAYLGKTSGRRETLDLAETCRQNLAMLQTALPKNVVVKTDLTRSGPWVHGNSNDIRQVLTNLATNAWEAMSEAGGSLHIAVDAVADLDIPKAHRFPIEWAPEDRAYACLEVRDTGSGIADADIEKIFDPFFSTKFAGRGLGLAVVLGIARAHGGVVTVESRVGGRMSEVGDQRSGVGGQNSETLGGLASLREKPVGSVFRVFLPLVEGEVSRAEKKSVAAGDAIQGGGTVLLIEDTEQVRKLGVRMLEYLGCRVIAAKDGVEGVEIFRERSEEIKFVLSDLTMPRMDGWKTIAALRDIRPDIPVILASGYDEASVMSGDHAERPQAFLAKPYSLEDLRVAISKVQGAVE